MPDTRFPRRATSARTAPAGPSSLPHTDDAAPRRSDAGGGTQPADSPQTAPETADGSAGSACPEQPDLAQHFAAFAADPPDDLAAVLARRPCRRDDQLRPGEQRAIARARSLYGLELDSSHDIHLLAGFLLSLDPDELLSWLGLDAAALAELDDLRSRLAGEAVLACDDPAEALHLARTAPDPLAALAALQRDHYGAPRDATLN